VIIPLIKVELVSPLVRTKCFPVALEVHEWLRLLAVNPLHAVSVRLAALAHDSRVEICVPCKSVLVLS
jgi:hypothetical protein